MFAIQIPTVMRMHSQDTDPISGGSIKSLDWNCPNTGKYIQMILIPDWYSDGVQLIDPHCSQIPLYNTNVLTPKLSNARGFWLKGMIIPIVHNTLVDRNTFMLL